MKVQLEAIYNETHAALENEKDIKQLDEIRIQVLGRKGRLTQLLHGLKDLSPDQRREAGQAANDIKNKLNQLVEKKIDELKRAGWISDTHLRPDATLPGRPSETGHHHILNKTMDEVISIFTRMGFGIAEGPEVETDYYNFEAVNFPADHPSRDEHDTFFISEKTLLRTHTTPVQIRYMEEHKPPIQVVIPGKTYRFDDDASHSPMFHQVEGLMIDKHISFCDLKAVLTLFIHRIFEEDLGVCFRPGFFPFTEPSAEIDINCVKCHGKGCSLCKGTGWMEILGSGMVHPSVLRNGGIDPKKIYRICVWAGCGKNCHAQVWN